MNRSTIAIVGGGFSGAAVAFHIARAGTPVLVFEPRATLGGGLAYGGDDPIHRVNVPVARMSLLPDDKAHFARWLEASGVLAEDPGALAGGEVYPRRREFRQYVAEALSPFLASGAIRHIAGSVASLSKAADGWRVQTAAGETFRADAAVIATTHCGSTLPPQLAAWRDHPRLIADPLANRVVRESERNERVILARTQGIYKSEMRNVARRSHSNMADTRAGTHGLINDCLDAAGHGVDESGALFRPLRNIRTGRLEGAITANGVSRLVRGYSGELWVLDRSACATRDRRDQRARSPGRHRQGASRKRQHLHYA